MAKGAINLSSAKPTYRLSGETPELPVKIYMAVLGKETQPKNTLWHVFAIPKEIDR